MLKSLSVILFWAALAWLAVVVAGTVAVQLLHGEEGTVKLNPFPWVVLAALVALAALARYLGG